MPLKNQFLTRISSGYGKISYQNKPQPFTTPGFTGDCLGVYSEKECCNKPGTTFTGAEICNYSSTKPGVGLVLCARGFDCIKSDFEEITVKSNKLLCFLQVTCKVELKKKNQEIKEELNQQEEK